MTPPDQIKAGCDALRRNCWTCKNDYTPEGDDQHWCAALDPDGYRLDVTNWWCSQDVIGDMPPEDADGCPGWKAKP